MSVREEIAALNAEYWARVDQRSEEPVAELYTEDGIFTAGSLMLTGRPAIAKFFAERNAAQLEVGRRTRHLQSNVELGTPETDPTTGAERIRSRSTVLVFAGVGELPLETTGPSTLADAEDTFVRPSGGQWRLDSRRLTPIFVGPHAAAFAKS